MATPLSAGVWSSLPTPLTPWILDVIQSMGHSHMTPVQASTIPLFMKHKDVVVEAVTGSGKTLAFVVPILERLIRREGKFRNDEIGALVISPTRELATQIHTIFKLFLDAQPSSDPDEARLYPEPLLLISSSQFSPAQDIQRFVSTGANIVIGTPGRVEEFLLGKGKNTVNVKQLEVLVLDEADRLLDLGFQVSLTKIITCLPKQRRTGLFSATMTDADALSELVRVGLRNPARVTVKVQAKKTKGNQGSNATPGDVVEERRIPANLQNFYLECSASEKVVQLSRIIAHETTQHQSSQFIVYFSTGACVDYFYKILPGLLPRSATFQSLHGNLPPAARTRALEAFSSAISTPSTPSILLATDVAARGLDIPNVDVVIQFDPPSDPKAFSHRCGRTARAGRSGRAWVLLVGREIEYTHFMSIRQIPMKPRPRFSKDNTPLADDDDENNERPEDPDVGQFLSSIRQHVSTDRTLHDLAIKAFVSFVRAYSKHEASYIFRLKDLDLLGVAKSYGLLRLPRMPELKDIDRSSWQDASLDWSAYAYVNPAQEAKRLAEVANVSERTSEKAKKNAERAEKKKNNVAWSDKVVRQEEREKRKEKKGRKKQWLKAQQATTIEPSSSTLKRNREADSESGEGGDDEDDWAALQKEERMAKKLRKGQISQREFDMAIDLDP